MVYLVLAFLGNIHELSLSLKLLHSSILCLICDFYMFLTGM